METLLLAVATMCATGYGGQWSDGVRREQINCVERVINCLYKEGYGQASTDTSKLDSLKNCVHKGRGGL